MSKPKEEYLKDVEKAADKFIKNAAPGGSKPIESDHSEYEKNRAIFKKEVSDAHNKFLDATNK